MGEYTSNIQNQISDIVASLETLQQAVLALESEEIQQPDSNNTNRADILGSSNNRFDALYLNGFEVDGGGNIIVSSNIDLGNDSSDQIKFTGSVHSDIIPYTTGQFSLGSSDHHFQSGFINNMQGDTINYNLGEFDSVKISGNDLAEEYNVLDNSEEGDLVKLADKNSVVKSTSPYQQSVIGVLSTKPGVIFSLSSENGSLFLTKPRPVALSGRILVKVSTENGNIKIGDYLTSSSIPGVAMKATKPGPTVGKALQAFDNTSEVEEGCYQANTSEVKCGKIMVFINLSFADPNNFFTSLALDSDGNLIVPKLTVGELVVDKSLIPTFVTHIFSGTDGSGNDYTTSIYNSEISEPINIAEKINNLDARVKSLEKKEANMLDGLAENNISLDLTPPDILLATASASLANLDVTSEATFSGTLHAYDLSVSNIFKSLGETILGKTLIAGDLIVDGTMTISGNSISSIGTLFLQNDPFDDSINMFNDKVIIDRNGNLRAQTITIAEFKVIANKISGSSKIPKGEKEVIVDNSLIKSDSRILITPTSETNSVLAVTKKLESKGFLVSTSQDAKEDIIFDWWLIGEVEN